MKHRARKRFGQHFLNDASVIDRIVSSINPRRDETVVEIGPGTGAITLPLLERAGTLTVVEFDRDLAATLQQRVGGAGELIVHCADALRFNFCDLAADKRLRLTGNLPYNISTPLLFHLMTHSHCIEDMHFMLQKEVVQRMAASAGERGYGRLSVMLAQHCTAESLFDIGPEAFRPPPRVQSSFVRLEPVRQAPFQVDDQAVFAHTVTRAFSMRRKTLRNALKGLVDSAQMEALGIDPGTRPETVAPADFARLANVAGSSNPPIGV